MFAGDPRDGLLGHLRRSRRSSKPAKPDAIEHTQGLTTKPGAYLLQLTSAPVRSSTGISLSTTRSHLPECSCPQDLARAGCWEQRAVFASQLAAARSMAATVSRSAGSEEISNCNYQQYGDCMHNVISGRLSRLPELSTFLSLFIHWLERIARISE